MVDRTKFSQELLSKPEAQSPGALDRIGQAKRRIQSILDRQIVANQRTLEQKISDQGPTNQRVDPHLVGLGLFDLLKLNRLRSHFHPKTGTKHWYANPGTADADVNSRLAELAPLYDSVSGHGFGNLTGDALELIVYKCLQEIYDDDPRYPYQGAFHLDKPKNAQGRYHKTQPPKAIGLFSTQKEADFLQFGHAPGALCIECKNYREWIYPHHEAIRDLIVKASELGAIPVLIARRIHYSAMTNLLAPAGIIAHESYYQYYPADQTELAERVKHKNSLGFTDVAATETPHDRTRKFFSNTLPSIVAPMAQRWKANQTALLEYANDDINQAQLYSAIGSPAGGKWKDFSQE